MCSLSCIARYANIAAEHSRNALRHTEKAARKDNRAITHDNEAHTYIRARANSMAEDGDLEDATVTDRIEMGRLSIVLKQALNNLADMINGSFNDAGAQDFRSEIRTWRGIHECLALERGKASSHRDKDNDQIWNIFNEDEALFRERIWDLRDIAEELSLNMKRIGADESS